MELNCLNGQMVRVARSFLRDPRLRQSERDVLVALYIIMAHPSSCLAQKEHLDRFF